MTFSCEKVSAQVPTWPLSPFAPASEVNQCCKKLRWLVGIGMFKQNCTNICNIMGENISASFADPCGTKCCTVSNLCYINNLVF